MPSIPLGGAPPLPSSHEPAPKPSPLLALVCLTLVHRFQRDWVRVDLSEAAATQGISPERLSRVASRLLDPCERSLALATRRGRPPRDPDDCVARELACTGALLEVATSLLQQLRPSARRRLRTLFVGAWLKLSREHAITQKSFCRILGLPQRTLRAWLVQASSPPAPESVPPAPHPPRRRRPPRRPRFGFDVTIPGTQVAADTTTFGAFGITLRLVAAQDVGGRDTSLLESVIVDHHESADRVIDVLKRAALPGAQAITDQGSPYMAKDTVDALDSLDVEHAPQEEGDPTAKATIERAFRSLKTIAGPLLSLSDRLAELWPSLRDPDLARASSRLLIATVLKAYQAGARATRRADDARGSMLAPRLLGSERLGFLGTAARA